MKKLLRSLFRDRSPSAVPRPLPPERWASFICDLRSQHGLVGEYFRSSVVPGLAGFLSSMSDRKILLPSGGTAALTAFFAHRALTLVGDLQYVAPRCGQDFADALCAGLYGNESFRMCRYLPRYFEAEDNQAIRKRFAGDIADLLGGQGSGAAMYIRPFALTSACDLDFLCCAGTAEAFGDTVNAQGILKQRDKFLAESQNA